MGLAELVVDDDHAGAVGGDKHPVGAADFASGVDNRRFVHHAVGTVEPVAVAALRLEGGVDFHLRHVAVFLDALAAGARFFCEIVFAM